jgi:hypothetical protein
MAKSQIGHLTAAIVNQLETVSKVCGCDHRKVLRRFFSDPESELWLELRESVAEK